MKTLAILVLLASPALAEVDYCPGALSVAVVTVSSYTGTSMLPTGGGWKSITIENIDSTDTMWCSDAVTVSSGVASASTQGFSILKATRATFPLVPKSQAWYCRGGSLTAAIKAVVGACR